MFKLFRKLMQNKHINPSDRSNKFERSSNMVFRIIQVATSIAVGFIFVELRSKKSQSSEYRMISKSTHYNDDEKDTKNLKDSSKRRGNARLQVVVSLATVVASVATCFTVMEMRSERIQLYKPQIIFESSNYSDDYLKSIWSMRDVTNLISLLHDENYYPSLETTIYNIGSGPALEVEINFMLDNYEKYIKKIGKYYSNGTLIADDYGFDIHYDGKIFRHNVNKEGCKIRKPFLLSGESMEIAIPKEFCELLYYMVYCTFGDYGSNPIINLQVSFRDLQGNEYYTDYQLMVKMITSASENGREYFHIDYCIEQEYLLDSK